MSESVRPTKKQQELLKFIEQFIGEHGYSPSYREVMTGLNYTSVATVALHINSLIKRGHLIKRDGKARSLEVAHPTIIPKTGDTTVKPSEEKWLIEKVEYFIAELEEAAEVTSAGFDQVYVLVSALKTLGLEAAVQSFSPRLQALKIRVTR